MRTFFFTAAALLGAVAPATAQLLSVGAGSMVVKSGTVVSAGGLSLTPSADLTLTTNTLAQSSTPYTATGGASINRVYSFSAPITYSGGITIRYAAGDLNGNAESNLQIAYGNATDYTTTTSSSTGASGSYTVSVGGLSNASFSHLTATNAGVVLPVALHRFQAEPQAGCAGVILEWGVTPGASVAVERSADGRSWTRLAAPSDASSGVGRFVDAQPLTGRSQYRLAIWAHGYAEASAPQYSASAAVRLDCAINASSISLAPNPAGSVLRVVRTGGPESPATVVVRGATGALLIRQDMPEGEAILDLGRLPAGVYVLEVTGENFAERQVFSRL